MDYSEIKTGDVEPYIGKKVKEIILSTNKFIVYMDEGDVIQWASDDIQYDEHFGEIANKISYWESICNRLFKEPECYDYKSLLAEGYARMLDDHNYGEANKIINQTIDRIEKNGKEVLRQDYLISSLIATGVVILLLVFTLLLKDTLNLSGGIFEIWLTGLMGGIGAFVSTMIRSKNYVPDIDVSKNVYYIDGFVRIIYGIIAGVVISLGIKANLIFGFVNELSDQTIYAELFLGTIGGASEVILPNIIKQIEHKG